MTIKHLYPTQRPSLDLNFASTKRLDPRVTFTRGSTATYVNAEGVIQTAASNEARFDHDPVTGESLGLLIEESRTNLLSYSEQIDNSYWTKISSSVTADQEIAPDGTITADLWTADSGGRLYKRLTVSDGIYNCSFFVKPKTNFTFRTVALPRSLTIADNEAQIDWDLSDGTFTTNATYIVGSPSILSLENGWFRCSFTYEKSGGSSDLEFRIAHVFSNTNQFYFWGAQLEEGSFPTSYISTPATFTSRASTATYYDANGIIQTAAIDEARDDAYFPDENGTFVSAGLLLEESRTNLYPYSETSGSWNVDNNATISTDGTTIAGMSAYKLTSNIDTNSLFLQGNDATFTANNTYTSSVYHKPGNVDGFWFEARFYTGGGTPKIYFDSSTETWSANSGTFNGQPWSVKSQKVESNAWRHSITFYVDTDTAGNLRMGGLAPANTTDVSTGDYGYLAAPQIETGSFPTSYIPTAGSTVTRAADVSSSSAVTRAADVAQITGSNFSSWYNQSEGTFYLDLPTPLNSVSNNDIIFSTNNGWQDENVLLQWVGTPYWKASGTQVATSPAKGADAVTGKYALAWDSSTIGASTDGNTAVTASAGTVKTTATTLNIFTGGTGTRPVGGTISRLTYYPQRLPDATLQALTL